MAQPIELDPSPSDSTFTSNGNTNRNGSSSSSSTTNGNGVVTTTTTTGGKGKMTDAQEYQEKGLDFKPLWGGSMLDRREVVRLTMQLLSELGYSETTTTLAEESGFELEDQRVARFREAILGGEWGEVEEMWRGLREGLLEGDHDSGMSGGGTEAEGPVLFLLRQQKFLEALEGKETKKALSILRTELAPLGQDPERLHLLSSWIMCASPEDLRERAEWDGVKGKSRERLLEALQQHISPTLMLPRRRLAVLLSQAQSYQRSQCLFHSPSSSLTLLSDCNCSPSLFPSQTVQILRGHTDEIWRLAFDHRGKRLATAGRDKSAIVWRFGGGERGEADEWELQLRLEEHNDPVSCLAWSPDDSILLTAAESVIKMWNTETGACIATLKEHLYTIGALSWLPDGKGFVSGGMDSRVLFWDLAGNVTSTLSNSPSRVIDLAVTPDGKRLVAVGRASLAPGAAGTTSQGGSLSGSRSQTPAPIPPVITKHGKRISVFNIKEGGIEFEIAQPGELTSISVSDDSRFAIVSHAPNEILYVDLRDGTIVRRYQGHDQGQEYVLQSCFGGALQNYVLSGGEDGHIYIWHRDTGNLIRVLEGHGPGLVNSVAWNSKHPGMFASASDDRTVRIWGFPDAAK